MFTRSHLQIVKFIAEEVTRQQAEPDKVYCMLVAWQHALDYFEVAKKENRTRQMLSSGLVEHWGRLIEPEKNKDGFRTVDVFVGGHRCPDPSQVPMLMHDWAQTVKGGLTPELTYISFLEVHPFKDGNGRTAKLIYFWLCEKLLEPNITSIPNPWGIANP